MLELKKYINRNDKIISIGCKTFDLLHGTGISSFYAIDNNSKDILDLKTRKYYTDDEKLKVNYIADPSRYCFLENSYDVGLLINIDHLEFFAIINLLEDLKSVCKKKVIVYKDNKLVDEALLKTHGYTTQVIEDKVIGVFTRK